MSAMFTNRLRRAIPAFQWMKGYGRAELRGDLMAGITVAVMLIPQGMAYAMLAGLPPIVGLYASVLPLFAYALLGSSRQLAVGPVAMVSLLVASGVTPLAGGDVETYIALAILLALMVGAIQLGMGLLRLGALVTFLSHPVISGFTSAAAIVIGLSQVKHLLGVDVASHPEVHRLVGALSMALPNAHWLTLGIGLAAVAVLLFLKRFRPRWPGALIVVAIGTGLTFALGLSGAGVSVVGEVPSGLPSLGVPSISLGQLSSLLPTAIVISLVGFMESVSVAKAFARRNRYRLDANQELVALGAANFAAAFSGGYPVTGGFSRTAVNAQAGARTPLATAITGAVIAITLLFLTSLLFFLPRAVLAAIVIAAVVGLIDYKEPAHLWKVKRSDALLWGLTFVATLALGIEEGIGLGVLASLGVFIHRSTRPHTAVLGRLPGTTNYRNLKNFPEAEEIEGLKIWRFDASFYFANADYFRDQVDAVLAGEEEASAIVIDFAGINDLDASAESMLKEIHQRLEEARVSLFLANVKGPVRQVLARGGATNAIGEDRFFLSVHEAVEAARATLEASPSTAPTPG